MIHFCTYFNENYLSRGLALYHSLEIHVTDFTLWVLCLDKVTADVLDKLNYSRLKIVLLIDIESHDKDLLAVKSSRSQIEYFFTLSPILPLYIVDKNPDIDSITYLDSDLYFYANPKPLYDELGTNSIYIIPHRFAEKYRDREKYGIYNVGLLIFKNDKRGNACLHWWREKCLEWCYDRLESDRFGDQKYLDRWTELFEGVKVSQNLGANLAPWNFPNYRIVTSSNGTATVDGQPLIFYHFQSLRLVNWWLYEPNTLQYGEPMAVSLVHWLYSPYIQILKNVHHAVKRTHIVVSSSFQQIQNAREITKKNRSLRRLLTEIVNNILFIHLGQ